MALGHDLLMFGKNAPILRTIRPRLRNAPRGRSGRFRLCGRFRPIRFPRLRALCVRLGGFAATAQDLLHADAERRGKRQKVFGIGHFARFPRPYRLRRNMHAFGKFRLRQPALFARANEDGIVFVPMSLPLYVLRRAFARR